MNGREVLARLQPQDRAWLTSLAALAGPRARVALVGGAVRDALLGVTPLDLDVVVEGTDVEGLARATGQPFIFHPAYQNATLHFPDGRSADLVQARSETYPVPGRNPAPHPGTLEDDLRRRDFSVNALALDLRSSDLLDVADSVNDLHGRLLRPLHARSFHEDASRLVRGARLAARLNLQATPELLAQVPDALAMADRTPRLWAELKLLLTEPRPALAALNLREWSAGELLPNLEVMLRLHERHAAGETVTPTTYAASLLTKAPDAHVLSEKLALGDKPWQLLERALSDTFYPDHSPERHLRHLLKPDSYVPLTGKDVLTLGIPPGPRVGHVLAHLAELRRAGRLKTREEERAALLDYVKTH